MGWVCRLAVIIAHALSISYTEGILAQMAILHDILASEKSNGEIWVIIGGRWT